MGIGMPFCSIIFSIKMKVRALNNLAIRIPMCFCAKIKSDKDYNLPCSCLILQLKEINFTSADIQNKLFFFIRGLKWYRYTFPKIRE